MELNDTALATIIAKTISSFASIVLPKRMRLLKILQNLDNQLDSILEIAIEYSYLESHAFT